ncbi:MAG: hypothetical protein M1830_002372 [Pleopsidium flavum]|nr:MAG: hypothetical protein M1830_002372 [Pleopsidium flavum]
MPFDEVPKPISIHIPPDLYHLTIPLSTWLKQHPQYDRLVVGAFIFTSRSNDQAGTQQPRLLLVQRSKTERAFPNLWEVPGGSSELSDPTILHSLARETFEETGLRLTRFVRQIGPGVEFSTGTKQREKKWLKLSFEIEVAEIPVSKAEVLGDMTHEHGEKPSHEVVDDGSSSQTPFDTILVTLDPEEHQRHAWVSEEEIGRCYLDHGPYPIVTEYQRQVMLQAFDLHKSQGPRLEQTTTIH